MALSKDKVDSLIEGFASRLASEIPIKEIILFGSYAHGRAKDYSDVDLAVVSDWFRGKPHIESMQYLSRVAASYCTLIEALPFTSEEVQNPDKRTFLAGILKTGRRYRFDIACFPQEGRPLT